MESRRFYRKFESRDRGEISLLVLALDEFCRQRGAQCIIEPLWVHIGADWEPTFSQVCRVYGVSDITPFREFLEKSNDELYAFIQDANESDMKKRGIKLKK